MAIDHCQRPAYHDSVLACRSGLVIVLDDADIDFLYVQMQYTF